MEFDFAGKVAIVTGAGHGLGRAMCAELSRRGAAIWATDILAEDLAETARVCRGPGGTCEVRSLDITREDAVTAFVAEASSTTGRIEILVNCAGGVQGQVGRPVEEISTEDWNAILAVNLTGTFFFCRAIAPLMKQQQYGRIVKI